jgi:hypothetical protein
VADIKAVKEKNKSPWKSGEKKNGRPKMSTRNVLKLKLQPTNIRRTNNGISR